MRTTAEQTLEEKLNKVEAALDHFYDTDTETLLLEYERYLRRKKEEASSENVDRDQALAYFATIPERCRNNESLEMKQEMLGVLSEQDLKDLCSQQANSFPQMKNEINSMFGFCLKMKRMMSV